MLGADFGGVLTLCRVRVAAGGLVTDHLESTQRGARCARRPGGLCCRRGRRSEAGVGDPSRYGDQRGWDGFTEIVRRKVATNLRVMRLTVWSWMVPIAAFFLLLSLTTSGTWRERFRGATDLRTGLMGLFVVGFLGGAVNDSGIVIPALALVYIGAFLMLVQVRKPFEAPEVRLPEDASPPIKPAPAVSG